MEWNTWIDVAVLMALGGLGLMAALRGRTRPWVRVRFANTLGEQQIESDRYYPQRVLLTRTRG